jgi:putative CocE/NonD family hydrolase
VLLARCPYGRRDPGILARLAPGAAARRGFLTVVQDVRGRFGSEGEWEPLVHEQDDGYDTVRWAAGLPGSDGRVAMYGPSYLGHTQWAAMAAAPPELVAAVPEFTWRDPYDGLVARGGAAEYGLTAQWTLGLGREVLRRRAGGGELARALKELAAAEAGLAAGAWDPPVLDTLPRPARPGGPPLPDGHTAPGVPTLTVAGWYDAFLQGSLDNHTAARAAGLPAALIVGPWTHEDRTAREFGPVAGEDRLDGGPSLRDRTLTWLAARLSVAPHTGPAVLVFVMGADEWRPLASWPPPATPAAWHLHPGGGLSPLPPAAGAALGVFRHDPADPVPTVGGALLLTPAYPAGPLDQRSVEARGDVLVHTGEPLSGPLEVMGRVGALLTVAAEGPADWVVRLCDVAPDGTSRVLTDGVTRTHGPGEREVRVDLWSTAHVFRPGHRLRVHVTSSSHPRWSAPPGPAGSRTVLRARITLPVRRRGRSGAPPAG